MTKKKLFAITMALLLAVTIPLAVLAETYDLAQGSITVEAKADGQYVSQEGGVQNEKQTTDTVIEQDKTESETTSNTITINAEKNTTAEVTISDVDIDVSGNSEAAISTGGEGNVTVELEGENTLKSGSEHAGLEKGNGGNLTIGDSDDDGSLAATGGAWSAGIGGSYQGDGSDITITGGDVTATGGTHGAGIGGGYQGSGTNITVKDGNVEATGQWNGAGIGGGFAGTGSDITIEGGNVKATGGTSAAGIGGGGQGNGTDIAITGGNVTASGGWNAAGIGGGWRGTGDSVSISGDAEVKVSGGENAAAIGDGRHGNGEITPDTSALGKDGSVAYFSPNADKSKDAPEKLLHKTSSGTVTHDGISIQSRVASTCTQSGSITYLCSCGQTFTQSLSPLGHDLERHEAKAATCTETGWNEYDTCKRAGCTYTTRGADLPIDPNNHDLEHHEAKAATCTEDGWYEYDTCKRCDYTTYRKIDKLNHSFTNYVFQNDATCLEDGTEIAQCDHTGCTATDERTAQGTAMGHSFTDYVFQNDATCLEDGTEIAQCDHTGCTATDERTAQGTATGHSFTDYVFQNDATCLEDGTEIAQCDHTGCTATDERTAVGSATGHSFTDYVSNKDATYTQDGTETAECDHGCGETDTRTVEGSKLPLYRVTDENGKSVIHKANYSGSTLTITAELDSAILTGSTLALPVLQARGITTIVFVTNGMTSTFELADLLAKGEGTYALTHAGENVTFLLNEEDIGSILK